MKYQELEILDQELLCRLYQCKGLLSPYLFSKNCRPILFITKNL